MYKFPHLVSAPHFFSSQNSALNAFGETSHEELLGVSGNLLSPLLSPSGNSKDCQDGILGHVLQDDVRFFPGTSSATMTGVLSNVEIGQVQSTVQAVQLPNQESEAIRNSANITGTGAILKSPNVTSDEIAAVHQEMLTLAFEISLEMPHWHASLDNLVVPQSLLDRAENPHAILQQRVAWLKKMQETLAKRSQAAIAIQQSAAPVQLGQRAVPMQNSSNDPATVTCSTKECGTYSLAPTYSTVSTSKSLCLSLEFGPLGPYDKRFKIPEHGVAGVHPLKKRKVDSSGIDIPDQLFSWCVHYVRYCAETNQRNCISARSLENKYLEAHGSLHKVSKRVGERCSESGAGNWFSLSDVFDVAEHEWRDIFKNVSRAQLIKLRSLAKQRRPDKALQDDTSFGGVEVELGGGNGESDGGSDSNGGGESKGKGGCSAEHLPPARCFVNTTKLLLIMFFVYLNHHHQNKLCC